MALWHRLIVCGPTRTFEVSRAVETGLLRVSHIKKGRLVRSMTRIIADPEGLLGNLCGISIWVASVSRGLSRSGRDLEGEGGGLRRPCSAGQAWPKGRRNSAGHLRRRGRAWSLAGTIWTVISQY
jgi:hypothetical protein